MVVVAGTPVRAKAVPSRRQVRSCQAMTLSADEYHDHLKTTSVRAGFSFDDVVLPSENTVLVGHLRFRYLDWGNEELRPLLFLHGGALTAHTWGLCCVSFAS